MITLTKRITPSTVAEFDALCNPLTTLAVDCLEGYADPIAAMILLKKIEKAAQYAMAQLDDVATTEAQKHHEAAHGFAYAGAKVAVRTVGARYDYKHLNSWQEVQQALKTCEQQAKRAYESTLRGEQLITDEGEIIEPATYTPGKLKITVTIKTE